LELLSFLSINRLDASLLNARALRVRFSKSLASRRHRLSRAKVRSTTQRRENAAAVVGFGSASDWVVAPIGGESE
jgi:hypothetical protein